MADSTPDPLGWLGQPEGRDVDAAWDYLRGVYGTSLPQHLNTLDQLAHRPL